MATVPATRPHVPAPLYLENGDHLSRAEFHERYEAMPWVKKAELISGVVYMASPAREPLHGEPVGLIVTWLGAYRATRPGVVLGDNSTVLLGVDDEVQPDAYLRIAAGGNSRLNDAGYVEGAPELVVEVAASSASIDLHTKMEAYRHAGVREYVVWRTVDEAVDWFALTDGRFLRLDPGSDGIIESRVFPELRLDVAALLAGDLAGVLEASAPAR